MRKIFVAIFSVLTVTGASAAEYAARDERGCPVCDCAASSERDNYVGFRVYKNTHASYSYGRADGYRNKYSKENFGFGTTVGNNLADWLRVEYETLYMGAEYTKRDTHFEYDIWANMLNAYAMYDFDDVVAPYVGAGVGGTGIWGEIDGHLDNAFDMSYQALAGILFRLNRRIDVDVGVKYINFGKVEHARGTTKVDATQIYIGATYKFGI